MKKPIKISLLVLVLIMLFSLSGCMGSNSESSYDKNGNILRYSVDDIKEGELWGYYVLNKDGSLSPLNNNASGSVENSNSTESGDTSSSERFFWWCNAYKDNNGITVKNDKLTPTITKETPLVAVFGSDSDVDYDTFNMERFAKLGYTIGAHISLSDNGKTAYLETQDPCPHTAMEESLSDIGTSERLELTAINDSSANVKLENIDTDINAFLGFEKNKRYKITAFVGTNTSSVETKADTAIFKSQEAVNIKNPYKKTSKGYFIVNLPENMKQGYYFVPGYGIFKVF